MSLGSSCAIAVHPAAWKGGRRDPNPKIVLEIEGIRRKVEQRLGPHEEIAVSRMMRAVGRKSTERVFAGLLAGEIEMKRAVKRVALEEKILAPIAGDALEGLESAGMLKTTPLPEKAGESQITRKGLEGKLKTLWVCLAGPLSHVGLFLGGVAGVSVILGSIAARIALELHASVKATQDIMGVVATFSLLPVFTGALRISCWLAERRVDAFMKNEQSVSAVLNVMRRMLDSALKEIR